VIEFTTSLTCEISEDPKDGEPSKPSLVNKGDNPNVKLGQCEGDCDSNADCQQGLVCYQRDTSADLVPGCSSGGSGDISDHD